MKRSWSSPRSPTSIRTCSIVERWDTASLYLLGQYAIDLTQESNDTTVQKLPELRYNIFEEKLAGPLHLNFEASATNFSRRQGDNVMRADFNPRLSAAFNIDGLTLTPRRRRAGNLL